MAGGMDLEQPRGRRLDAVINLVPFIDLMAVAISFLIFTAVWSQVGAIKVTAGDRQSGVADNETPVAPLVLRISTRELALSSEGTLLWSSAAVRDAAGELQVATLLSALGAHRGSLRPPPLQFEVDETVPYSQLVRLLDACAGAGFAHPSIAIEN